MGLDPQQFFDGDAGRCVSDGFMRIWREPETRAAPSTTSWAYVRLDHDIDDAGSERWRGTVDAHVAERGWPTLMILDVHAVVATNSIAMRFKSAGWARNHRRARSACR